MSQPTAAKSSIYGWRGAQHRHHRGSALASPDDPGIGLMSLDFTLCHDLDATGPKWLDDLFAWMATYLPAVIVVIVVLLFLVPWTRRRLPRGQGAVMGTVAAAALAINQPIAGAVARSWPYVTHPHAQLLIGRSHDPSSPSDHATGAFAIAVAVWFYDRVAGTTSTSPASPCWSWRWPGSPSNSPARACERQPNMCERPLTEHAQRLLSLLGAKASALRDTYRGLHGTLVGEPPTAGCPAQPSVAVIVRAVRIARELDQLEEQLRRDAARLLTGTALDGLAGQLTNDASSRPLDRRDVASTSHRTRPRSAP